MKDVFMDTTKVMFKGQVYHSKEDTKSFEF